METKIKKSEMFTPEYFQAGTIYKYFCNRDTHTSALARARDLKRAGHLAIIKHIGNSYVVYHFNPVWDEVYNSDGTIKNVSK